uniref:CSC1/OSCA1-like 7TM region domain-containing protein n=1 Tax=Oryza glumipatula TaxID=40148 RepID=A0A0D9ZBG7_9ORYZ
MKVGALLTSAGINISLCILFLSLYSVLRKQPQNVKVYFGRRIAEENSRLREAFILERFVPSASWILRSLRCTEDELLATAGLDAVVFNRILVFSSSTELFWTRYAPCTDSFSIVGDIYNWKYAREIKMTGAKKAYKKFKHFKGTTVDQRCGPITYRCGLCGASSKSFELLPVEPEQEMKKHDVKDSELSLPDKDCGAAFVFFKTRYAALVVSEIVQTSNPMEWVTSLAPDRDDVYWSNLWLPYKQLWIRRIVTLSGSIVFMFLFLIPVTFIQGLTQLEQLQQRLSFLNGILKKKYITQLVTGYLPSVILQIFLYTVPPTMMFFSTLEGPVSHSERKRSACCKVLYFTIWNVFFVNVLSGSAISQVNALSSPKDIPMVLARAVPVQATFFTTYVLTSGWASLSSELMQLFGLTWNFIMKYVLRMKEDSYFVPSFPYHTEVPKVLLFGLLGFTCSVLAPLILPFLLVYFFLGYVVYRNQFLNVYCTKYDTGGLYWPIAHYTTIFSIVLTQIICLGVFGLKESPASLIAAIVFGHYSRLSLHREDEQSGRMDDIHHRLHSAYCQFADTDDIPLKGVHVDRDADASGSSGESSCKEDTNQPTTSDISHPTLEGLPVNRLRHAVRSLSSIIRLQKRGLSPQPAGPSADVNPQTA